MVARWSPADRPDTTVSRVVPLVACRAKQPKFREFRQAILSSPESSKRFGYQTSPTKLSTALFVRRDHLQAGPPDDPPSRSPPPTWWAQATNKSGSTYAASSRRFETTAVAVLDPQRKLRRLFMLACLGPRPCRHLLGTSSVVAVVNVQNPVALKSCL